MSLPPTGDVKTQEVNDSSKQPVRCRIPQRMPISRQKPATVKNKITNNGENTKFKFESMNTNRVQRSLTTRPRSTESRPKSGSRRDESMSGKQAYPAPRSARPVDRERLQPAPRRQSTIPKRVMTPVNTTYITIPYSQKPVKGMAIKKQPPLPDQDTIKKCEELELKHVLSTVTQLLECEEKESITSVSDRIDRIKQSWKERTAQFEKMKIDLNGRQKALMELYAVMRETHLKMSSMGHIMNMPPPEELRVMNVAQMSPDQLLQLCAGQQDDKLQHREGKGLITIDINKLYNMPGKLIATCEQTLTKRKEIIDWFETLKAEEKGISQNSLTKKIKEFNAENEMLNCSLQNVRAEFMKELNEIVDYLRKGVNETMALHLRSEELTYELSELNAQNGDLRKQIHTADHLKSVHIRHKIEALEKDLKEERSKKMLFRDRLTRAEGQIKIGAERASQLEAALEQSRSQTWALERTVQQLHEQNQQLQIDFDKELNKLTDSIRENTVHLEEIAEAREKLQTEKEDLEKRLHELSENYKESLHNMKHELNVNVAKVVETETKFDEEKKERMKLEAKLESLCAQLLESELRYKDVMKKLQERETQLCKVKNIQNELDDTKHLLDVANLEIEEYRNRLMRQNDTIREIERNFKETINIEAKLKHDLNVKEDYVAELEKKQLLLEQELQESDCKMAKYEEQLTSLKSHITQLQSDFGEFENLNELRDMINQQRSKLLEATRQNGELAEALQKKDIDLEHHMENITEQEHILEQREGLIKMLSEKEEEQANIIKLLRNNLEMRSQADNDLSHQLSEKNAEIDSLITNVETRKLQITQLEKIILTLEDQLRKLNLQRRKDQEKMTILEKTVTEYESYHAENNRSIEAPADNLDNLIKILEDELGSPFEPQSKEQEYRKKLMNHKKRDKLDKFEYHGRKDNQAEHEKIPTKIVMGNFVKKTYISTNDEQYKGDNLDRKKAITNMDTQKWISSPEPGVNLYASPPPLQDDFQPFRGMVPVPKEHFTRNLQFFMSNQVRDEKKCKMFKFAGHRL